MFYVCVPHDHLKGHQAIRNHFLVISSLFCFDRRHKFQGVEVFESPNEAKRPPLIQHNRAEIRGYNIYCSAFYYES